MPSKKTLIRDLNEIKSKLKLLEEGMNEHYEPKDIIIKDENSDLYIEILSNGWTSIKTDYGENISLGKYPNKRFEILIKMLEKVKSNGELDLWK